MKKLYIIFFTLLPFVQLSRAQVTQVKLLTGNPVEYKKMEWDIRLVENWTNAFLQEDIALDMLITSPSGKALILPCYIDSGESGKESLWKARFAPQEKGRFKYSIKLSKEGKTVYTSGNYNFKVASSNEKGFLHPGSNWVLKFDNGKPFRGIGENIGWESKINDANKFIKTVDENPKYNYEYMLRSLAVNGGNFFRTWMTNQNLPLDWKKPSNNTRYTPSDEYFNPSAIKKIDRLTSLCDSLGIHIMLTLGMGAYSSRDGGFASSATDFFVNPKSKARYKNRLRYIISRWGYSTSIGAWELFNEIDNVQFSNKENPINADTIVKWHDEMSSYIKRTDPFGHLVTTSISHRDLKGLNSLPYIDINQKHIYRNTSSIPSTITRYENDFKKPYVIGEFSYEWDWAKDFKDFADDMDLDFKRGLWYGLFSPTPILPMSWWWEYFEDRGMNPYFKAVREISDQMLASGNGSFEIVPVQADGMEAFSVKCGAKIFVYMFNNTKTVVKSALLVKGIPDNQYKVQSFSTLNLEYKDLGNPDNTSSGMTLKEVVLNPKSEIVYIFTSNHKGGKK
jgi:hypothetical protein